MVDSPCVKICELKGEICIGCGRTRHEIGGWMSMSDAEKRDTVARAKDRLKRLAQPNAEPAKV